MRKFQFSMDAALNWRRRLLDIEEAKFKQVTAEFQKAESSLQELMAEKAREDQRLRESETISGDDLHGMAIYRVGFVRRRERLAEARRQWEIRLNDQRQKMVEARRKVKVIEKLREKKLDEWTREYEKELENLATEAFLAQWDPGQEF